MRTETFAWWNHLAPPRLVRYQTSWPMTIASAVRLRKAGTASVARRLFALRSMSASSLVALRPNEPPPSGILKVPSNASETWRLFRFAVASRPWPMMSTGSVIAGVLWQAASTASMTTTSGADLRSTSSPS